ncbi:MAG: tRNA (adenosine(37)-N6)-threonylcarbamoyltransferase complex transferase subunit TsaD [Parachlamydiaceae bacterium]|nr:tRNA (adenosine(37)-N6)-threonylcarbamoyltransferase complex transferase subunit TsaD [Parachlamydiaceae bacterium]
MLVLGLESTCDETACAIVRDGTEILSSVVSSQINLHAQYGGVVPELACRRHVDVMIPVIDQALSQANISLEMVDLIAVANGPGLIGALLLGLNTAKTLALALKKPLIGVNHIEAHLYAAMMSHPHPMEFPCMGVVLSGGHTSLMHLTCLSTHTIVGQTIDDAIGEAFDKVAKILNLPYPGGPQIERLAQQGDPKKYPFRSGRIKNSPLDFSFSGLKTAVLYATRKLTLSEQDRCDVAASFQQAAFQDVIHKTVLAAEQTQCQTLLFGGGVTNNQKLRHLFAVQAPQYQQLWPTIGLSLDNAAMIAGLGYHRFLSKGADDLHLQAFTRL